MADQNFFLRVRSTLVVLGLLLIGALVLPVTVLWQWVFYGVALGAAFESALLLKSFFGLFPGRQLLLALLASALQGGYYALSMNMSLAVIITFVALWYYRIPPPPSERRLLSVLFIPALFAILGWALQCSFLWREQLIDPQFYSPIVIAVMSDICGYLVGKFFPSTRCDYAVSPRKTYEGFLGALLMPLLLYPCITQIVWFCPLSSYEVWQILLLTAAAIWGDLIFSLGKRLAQQKDYSALFPGHGGMLDRIDSWVGALFVALVSPMLN